VGLVLQALPTIAASTRRSGSVFSRRFTQKNADQKMPLLVLWFF